MDSILNIQVSCFENYNSTYSKPANLLTWLRSDNYRIQVEAIRLEPDKARRDGLKAQLPAITPSGLFTERNSRSLTKHSGFIAFDIDVKGNEHIGNYSELKTEITKIQNVAYAGLSVSGTGLWGLIPIAYPEKHKSHFAALEKSFSKRGITIDTSCKDICRLRGYSYDPEGYFNHYAKPFTGIIEPTKPRRPTYKVFGDDDRAKVEEILNKLSFDITADYKTWFEIGCSLANTFGEDGRNYFHAVSQYHNDYSYSETEKQYNYCLKGKYSFKLGTLFHYLKLAGIEPEKKNDLNRGHRLNDHQPVNINVPQEYALDGTPIGPKGYPVSWDIPETPLARMIKNNPSIKLLIDRLDLIPLN